MVVLRGAQAVGLGPNFGHLIYIYKSKITKYMYIVQCPIHRNRKVVLHIFLKPGAIAYEEFYIHYTKLSFTYSRKHTFDCVCLAQGTPSCFHRLACGSYKLLDPGAPPRLTPLLSMAWLYYLTWWWINDVNSVIICVFVLPEPVIKIKYVNNVITYVYMHWLLSSLFCFWYLSVSQGICFISEMYWILRWKIVLIIRI